MTKTYQSHEINAQLEICKVIAELANAGRHHLYDSETGKIIIAEMKRLHETPIILSNSAPLCTCPNDIALGCAPKPECAKEWQDLGLTPTGEIA